MVYPGHTHLLFGANAEDQKSDMRAPIPSQKIKKYQIRCTKLILHSVI